MADDPIDPFGDAAVDAGIDPEAILTSVRERLNLEPDVTDDEPELDGGDIVDEAVDAETTEDPESTEETDPEGEQARRPLPPSGSDDTPDEDTTPTDDASPTDEPTAPVEVPVEDTAPDVAPPVEEDEWTRTGEYFEQVYGARPSVEDIVNLDAYWREVDPFIQAVNQLPEEHREIINQMVNGQFDSQRFAAKYAPRQPQTDDWGDPIDPTPTTTPALGREEELLSELRAIRQQTEAQNRTNQFRSVEQQADQAVQAFRQANPHISDRDLIEIRQRVHQRGVWQREVQSGMSPGERYLAHLAAEARLSGVGGGTSTPPASATPSTPDTPTPAPTPDPEQDRKAASGAIAGSSTAARPPKRRKSALDSRSQDRPSSLRQTPAGAAKSQLTEDILSALGN